MSLYKCVLMYVRECAYMYTDLHSATAEVFMTMCTIYLEYTP